MGNSRGSEAERRAALSWRGPGPGRPDLPLPPTQLPLMQRGSLRKRWRYVGFYGDRVMICLATVLIGPARHCFWSFWDRETGAVLGHTQLRPGRQEVALEGNYAELDYRGRGGPVRASLELGPAEPVEVVQPSGHGWGWTRKRAGVPITGRIETPGRTWDLDGFGVDDESAGFQARYTAWLWSAGVGTSIDGRQVAWNLVSGINDPDTGSERAVWVDGEPYEPAPVQFDDLNGVAFAAPDSGSGPGNVAPTDRPRLRFEPGAGAERRRKDNFLVVRSEYTHRFGAFTGSLDGIELATGSGVMEEHRAVW
ncbi:MAG: DUF2804 domain-containing protein [Solirubrobacterales bacterium]|nr:DUF2804 domain-containing protein [Solirubrobacterales bacterium]